MEELIRKFHHTALLQTGLKESSFLFEALRGAGWSILSGDTATSDDATMIVSLPSSDDQAPLPTDAKLSIALGVPSYHSAAGHDAWITGEEDRAELTAFFTRWLPPDLVALERLADAFGRSAVEQLTVSLREELRGALAALSRGDLPDGHKLSGLAGTLGFAAASEAWRDADQACGIDDARRTSRTAIVAITHWLESAGQPTLASGSSLESAG